MSRNSGSKVDKSPEQDAQAFMHRNRENFRRELEGLINRYSQENGSNTPDFILAEYLVSCLETFDRAVNKRQEWEAVPEPPSTVSVV
jgi:hypothetical protein